MPGAEQDVLDGIRETTKHVKEAKAVRPSLEAQDDYKLAESKMRRALDRLKRAAVKVVDAPDDMVSTDGFVKAVRMLLLDIATTMEVLLSAVCTVRDLVATHVLLVPPPGSEICIRRLCLVT
jgi:hypothetical protein